MISQLHGQPAGLGPPHEFQGTGRGDVGEVQSRAWGCLGRTRGGYRHIWPDRYLLRRRGPAAQTQDRRHEAVIRLGAIGQGRVLGMVGRSLQVRARPRRPRHCAAGPRPDSNRCPIVREADDVRRRPSSPSAASGSPSPSQRSTAPCARSSTGDPDAAVGRPDLRQHPGFIEGRVSSSALRTRS